MLKVIYFWSVLVLLKTAAHAIDAADKLKPFIVKHYALASAKKALADAEFELGGDDFVSFASVIGVLLVCYGIGTGVM